MKVVLLSYHYFNSKNKAGFHFITQALSKKGFDVVFVTIPFSLFSIVKRDFRINNDKFFSNLFRPVKFGKITSIINFSIFHPINRNSIILEKATNLFFNLNYKVKEQIKDADYIIFESTPAIIFFDLIKQKNPKAKMIYRMSDDMEMLNIPKIVISYERKVLEKFDLVSVPTKFMFDKFIKISPTNVKLHYHGIDKELFDKANSSPYPVGTINHIFVGNSYLDENFIDIASDIFKNHYFHIIGPFKPNIKKENVIYYGKMAFKDTIPFIKFASTGLQLMTNAKGVAETLADSLKVIQYSYCKLPIIAPDVIQAYYRKNFFYYKYNDRYSIEKCIEEALKFDKSNFDNSDIYSWDELVDQLIYGIKE